MRIIIIGCGKIGKSLAEKLVSEGHDVTVIDKAPESSLSAQCCAKTRSSSPTDASSSRAVTVSP